VRFWISVTAAAVIANAAIAMIGRGSFLPAFIVVSMAMAIAVPAFVLAFIFFFFRRRSPRCARVFRWAAILGVVFASCLPSLPAGYLVAGYDIANAKAYCEALAPKLEAYHSRSGSYPRDILLVVDTSNCPRLLRSPTFYYNAGPTYVFFFDDPHGFFHTWSWDSARREWMLGAD
jgi:hypothetical protein